MFLFLRTSTFVLVFCLFDNNLRICRKPVIRFFFSHHSTKMLSENVGLEWFVVRTNSAAKLSTLVSLYEYVNFYTLVSSCEAHRRRWSPKVTTIDSTIVWSRSTTLLRILCYACTRWNQCYEIQNALAVVRFTRSRSEFQMLSSAALW